MKPVTTWPLRSTDKQERVKTVGEVKAQREMDIKVAEWRLVQMRGHVTRFRVGDDAARSMLMAALDVFAEHVEQSKKEGDSEG